MNIILVRHAESEKNIADKFDKGENSNDYITAYGNIQLSKIADFLKSIINVNCNSILITGDRKRALSSTIRLSKLLKCNYKIEKNLLPINPGDLAGLPKAKAIENYPQLMQNRVLFSENLYSGYDLLFPNGDLISEYEKLIEICISKIVKEHVQFNNIIIITHRSVILAILNIYNKIFGIQEKRTYKYYNTPPGCIVEIKISLINNNEIIYHGGIEEWDKR